MEMRSVTIESFIKEPLLIIIENDVYKILNFQQKITLGPALGFIIEIRRIRGHGCRIYPDSVVGGSSVYFVITDRSNYIPQNPSVVVNIDRSVAYDHRVSTATPPESTFFVDKIPNYLDYIFLVIIFLIVIVAIAFSASYITYHIKNKST